jgi:hypothetical protein
MTTATSPIPVRIDDPINAQILAVSEDKIQGFLPDPLAEIARLSNVPLETVVQRIAAMLRAGTIRRVRQTLMATNLAPGSLVAWKISEDKLSGAFDWMFQHDPFSGHVVIRSTDAQTQGSVYRLWTTLKVPQGFSMTKHCDYLCKVTGAERYKLMPAKHLFALGVGHVRRKGMEPGARADVPAEVLNTNIVELNELDWQVLAALKREFTADEIQNSEFRIAEALPSLQNFFWSHRATEAHVDLPTFLRVAKSLNDRKVIGRFSTFLEHVKQLKTGEHVTKYNALFHWAVPSGMEIEAGKEVGRHHIMTHAYWREGGAEFNHVNVMGVAHGTDRQLVLAHKAAIDQHLSEAGIPVSYTNVFWGGRSEIKPSEISPQAYREWCTSQGINAETMR